MLTVAIDSSYKKRKAKTKNVHERMVFLHIQIQPFVTSSTIALTMMQSKWHARMVYISMNIPERVFGQTQLTVKDAKRPKVNRCEKFHFEQKYFNCIFRSLQNFQIPKIRMNSNVQNKALKRPIRKVKQLPIQDFNMKPIAKNSMFVWMELRSAYLHVNQN